MTNLIERIKSVAGQDFDSYGCRVRNPHITARQSIEIADYIVKLEQERNELAAQVERLRGAAYGILVNRTGTDEWYDLEKVYRETPPAALAVLKAQWQAEAFNSAADMCYTEAGTHINGMRVPPEAAALFIVSTKIRQRVPEAGDV